MIYTENGEIFSAVDVFVRENNIGEHAENALREQALDIQSLVLTKPITGVDKSRILLGRIRQLQQEDWICGSCGNQNYTKRMFCNSRKCALPRTGLEVHVRPNPLVSSRGKAK